MRLTEEKRDRILILGIEGRIDQVTSPDLESALLEIIRRGERSIVLDMAGVDYVSSAGLRVFLIGARQMKECQGTICLTGLRPAIKDILAITGFLNLFRIFKSPEDAVAELDVVP